MCLIAGELCDVLMTRQDPGAALLEDLPLYLPGALLRFEERALGYGVQLLQQPLQRRVCNLTVYAYGVLHTGLQRDPLEVCPQLPNRERVRIPHALPKLLLEGHGPFADLLLVHARIFRSPGPLRLFEGHVLHRIVSGRFEQPARLVAAYGGVRGVGLVEYCQDYFVVLSSILCPL